MYYLTFSKTLIYIEFSKAWFWYIFYFFWGRLHFTRLFTTFIDRFRYKYGFMYFPEFNGRQPNKQWLLDIYFLKEQHFIFSIETLFSSPHISGTGILPKRTESNNFHLRLEEVLKKAAALYPKPSHTTTPSL